MEQFAGILDILACPACKQSLVLSEHGGYRCQNSVCAKEFPIVNHIPVLINEENSVFDIEGIASSEGTETANSDSFFVRMIKKLIPSVTYNWKAKANCAEISELLEASAENPVILIVGCGDGGSGLGQLLNNENLRFVDTDIYLSSRAQVIADGHDLPFKDTTFDAVICQAVLEHVLDPHRCVSEMHRVLKVGGFVYAETPFLYPVHMKAHDFTRFTLGGHRRLFRYFDEINAGAVLGPATTLTLSILSFFSAFSQAVIYRRICNTVLPFLVFWLKYLDYFLIDREPASDSAASFFFIGRRRASAVSDREIMKWHWTSSTKIQKPPR